MKGATKKFVRKTVSIITVVIGIVIFALSVFFAVKSEEKEGIKLYAATDLHVIANEAMSKEEYETYGQTDKLKHISEAIFSTFTDELAKKGAEYLIISGDLTEYGDEESHRAVAEVLKRAKERGIKTFVVNGNHDIDYFNTGERVTQARFKEIYADFGYKDAYDSYEGTLSYVAQLDEKHTVIAIDNIEYYRDDGTKKEEMDDGHRLWIYDKIDECKDKGKTPIVIAHKPLMNHFPEIIEAFEYVSHNNSLLEYMAKNGAPYVFVGHMHINDIKENKYAVGEERYSVYEIMSSCLAMYNCSYREIKLGEKEVSVQSIELESVDSRYLPVYADEADKKEYGENFKEYSKNNLSDYVKKMVDKLFDEGGLLYFKIPDKLSGISELYQIIKEEALKKSFSTPYYKEDESAGGTSMERILESYGLQMPQTEYRNFYDFANDALEEIVKGNRNFRDENFGELVKYTLYEIIWYIDAASDELNGKLSELGYDGSINLDMERLFRDGELECYESGFIPTLTELAEDIIKEVVPSDYEDIVNGIVSQLKSNLDVLKNSIVTGAVNGFTNDVLKGYEEYIYSDYIDLGALIDEGILGKYVADYLDPPAIAGSGFVIEK